MTPEELNERLARYMGWQQVDATGPVVYGRYWAHAAGRISPDGPPPYASDLNLLATVEARVLAEGKGESYWRRLDHLTWLSLDTQQRDGDYSPYVATAPAATRAAALIAVLGPEDA